MLNKLRAQIENNPGGAVVVGAFALTAIASFLKATNETRNSRAWAKEVKRRDRKDRS